MDEVSSVTVVDVNPNVIELFNKYILPQFERRDKVRVILADAFEYAEKTAPYENYDYIYADTWHDVSDGVDMYNRFKALERFTPSAEHTYWIEKTMKCYTDGLI
jgi:spermidine synthase